MSRRSQLQNPFVGLRPFESEDSLYYFGRREQINALLQHLHQTHFLAVVGSSGCGKSSLLRAGLIPNLEAGFLVQDRDVWHIATMKPGEAPLQNLARALLNALGQSTETEALEYYTENIRRRGAQAVLEKTLPMLDDRDANLLLLVDQFEELFRFHRERDQGEGEAADFVNILLRVVEQTEAPIFICLTMRSDFLGDCDAFQGLPEAMNRSQYLVPRLTRQQRREAISNPIYLSGARIAPRLLDRLLNENVGTRDDLPILQHALMRTWAQWVGDNHGPIDMVHYEKIHTVKRALNEHAEEALNELSEEDRVIAKRLFQTITETDAGNRRVRRPAHLSEIVAVSDTTPQKALEVIEKFREDDRNFLVLSSEIPQDDPLVDISHESFIRQWLTLSHWVDEEAESAKIYRRLAETAELHAADRAGLYREADLHVALEWREDRKPNEDWGRRYHTGFDRAMDFLDESSGARHREALKREKERAERERLLHEKNDLLEQQTDQQKRTLRQARIFIAVLALVLAAAISAGILAFNQWQQAKQKTKQAELNLAKSYDANFNIAKVFEEKALQALDDARKHNDVGNYKQTWLYTAEALKQEIGPGRMALNMKSASELLAPETIKSAFAEKWFSPSVAFHTKPVKSVAFSPDGKTLASGSWDNTIRLWDMVSGNSLRELKGPAVYYQSVIFSPDGKTLASGSNDLTIRLWDVATGESLRELNGHTNSVNSVAFSPDGKTLASGSSDTTIRLWDVATGESLRELKGHTKSVESVAFSPDGKTLASGSWDNTIRLWDVASGESLHKLKEHANTVKSVAFSPDGKTLASGSADHTIRLWDAVFGNSLRELKGHYDSVESVAFSPDGKTLASGSGSYDNTIRLWDIPSGNNQGQFTGHADWVWSVAFSPDGKTLASGSFDNTIHLKDVATGNSLHVLKGHAYSVRSVAFSPNGKTLASGSGDKTIRLWDVATGNSLRELKGHAKSVLSVAFSSDGKTLASGSRDKTIRLWDVATGNSMRELKGHTKDVNSVAFSPDGKTLASGSDTLRLWDLKSGKNPRELKGHAHSVRSVSFSPNGKTLASGSNDPTIRLWDVATGNSLRKLKGHAESVLSVAFSPDGKTLASGSYDQTIRLWNVATGKSMRVLRGHAESVWSVAFSPKGKTLASGSRDKTIRLWDIRSGSSMRMFKGGYDLKGVAFSPDGKTLASRYGPYAKTIRLWDVQSGNSLEKLKGPIKSVKSMAFSPDGKTLASGSSDNVIQLWDVASGNSLHELKGHTKSVSSVAFSPDGKILASGSWDKTIRLWDVATGKRLRELKGHVASVNSIAFSPDGKTLVSGASDTLRLWDSDVESKTIRLWDVQSGESLWEERGHAADVSSVAFSPDGKILASLAKDNTIRLWDAKSGNRLHVLKGHDGSVLSMAFSPDGKILASGGSDKTIRLWDVESGKILRELKGHDSSVLGVAFSLDGKTLFSGSYRTMRSWDISLYFILLKDGKPTRLFYAFAEGVQFFWQVRLEKLEFKRHVTTPRLYPKDEYYFKYNHKFRPLLNPPAPGQSKFDQILEWAKGQLEKGEQ